MRAKITATISVILLASICFAIDPAAAARVNGEKITREEETAARALASRFVERLRQTDDIAPLIDELFIDDFGARLRDNPNEAPMLFIARDVAGRASSDDLRSFYIAEFNLFTRMLEYAMNSSRIRESAGLEDDDSSLEESLPPAVVIALQADPVFSKEFEKERKQNSEARPELNQSSEAYEPDSSHSATNNTETPAKDGDEDDVRIKSLEALFASTDAVGKAAAAFRPLAPSLLTLQQLQQEGIDDQYFEEIHDPRIDDCNDSPHGFPEGTRIIRINVEPVHDFQFILLMVEIEGRMRIVEAFPALGD